MTKIPRLAESRHTKIPIRRSNTFTVCLQKWAIELKENTTY